MATQGQVTKIYDLRTLGFKDITKELTTVNDLFEKIKKSKLSAQGKLVAAQDINDIKKYADEVAKLQVEEQRLRTERQRMINEQKAAQTLRQAEIQQEKQRTAGLKDSSGWYYKLTAQIKELGVAIKSVNSPGENVSFRGQSLQYDQAITKLKELTTAEQDFRRQFAKDGLLVAEYSSGIVQAFKQMGLDDLIGGQITKGQERIQQLNSEFNKLQQELSETKVTGQGSFESIEKKLIDNRKEVISLTQSVDQLKTEYRGTGDVGNQITKSISNGFKEMKNNLSSFVLQYIGFQALFNKVSTEVSEGIIDAKQIEGVTAAFARLNDPNLLANLKAATRNTVSDLKLMQITVQATNFQIPQEKLGFLLDFARRRAKETGQSVDYLVDSIITGIGRKSPLILDNLGISAVRLRSKLKGVAEENANVGDVAEAVAQIIKEENEKAGLEIETQSEKIQQNEATWKNLRLELAQNLLPVLTTIGSLFLVLVTNLPTLATILAVLAVGWGVANAQLLIQNTQLVLYNLLIIRNYIALGILGTVQLAWNAALLVGNGILRLATAAMGLFGVTTTAATGPLGVILTLVGLIGTALVGISKAMGNYTEVINRNTQSLRIQREVAMEAAQATQEQRSKAEALVSIVKDLTISEETRNNALKKLIDLDPVFQKALKDGKINYEELTKALNEYNNSLIKNATIQAAQARVTKEQQELTRLISLRQNLEERKSGLRSKNFSDLPDAEKDLFVNDRLFSLQGFRGTSSLLGLNISDKEFDKAIANVNRMIDKQSTLANVTATTFTDLLKTDLATPTVGPVGRTIDLIKKDLEKAEKDFSSSVVGSAEYKRLKQKVIDLRKELENAQIPTNNTDYKGSRLTGAQKDAFKDIEAIRDKEIAIERKKRLENTIDEETYLKNILRINAEAITKKLNIIKGTNAEERKQIAELNLEKITNEQETNQKIFDLRIEQRKAALDQIIRDANTAADAIANDPLSTPTQIAQARINADNTILAAQIQLGNDLDKLEKELGQQSIQNENETAQAVMKTRQQLADDEKKLLEARIEEIRINSDKEVSQINIDFAKLRSAILSNDKLTATQKAAQIERLSKLENFTLISAEVKRLAEEFKAKEEQYKKGLITEAAYLKAKAELEAAYNKQQEAKTDLEKNGNILLPSSQSAQNLLKERLSKSFGFADGSANDQLLGNVLGQTFDFAKASMNAYFDAEEARIRNSLDLQLQRIDKEKQLVVSRAQSQSEIDAIEKQYAQKKQQAEKEAGEKLKKSKKSEAAIALASELANIAVSAAANPANGVTFGEAGAVMYGILAALALGKYQLRVNEINRQQFEYGGDVPTHGGMFGGKSHSQGGTPFTFKGQSYEAEVDEMSVIRTKNAPRNKVFKLVGTQKQIASALNQIGGGISFAKGARVEQFANGGNLGESLQAPVFMPNSNTLLLTANSGITEEKFETFMNEIRNLAQEQSRRIDRLEVVQVTSTVTKAQKKEVQQSEIATL